MITYATAQFKPRGRRGTYKGRRGRGSQVSLSVAALSMNLLNALTVPHYGHVYHHKRRSFLLEALNLVETTR